MLHLNDNCFQTYFQLHSAHEIALSAFYYPDILYVGEKNLPTHDIFPLFCHVREKNLPYT